MKSSDIPQQPQTQQSLADQLSELTTWAKRLGLYDADDVLTRLEGVSAFGGHWQKEVPAQSGQYWTATRDGLAAGLRQVTYDEKGRLLFAGSTRDSWAGWWWSEPVVPPAPPAKDEWEKP